MNVSDSEVAWSVLKNSGYQRTERVQEVRYLNVCKFLSVQIVIVSV